MKHLALSIICIALLSVCTATQSPAQAKTRTGNRAGASSVLRLRAVRPAGPTGPVRMHGHSPKVMRGAPSATHRRQELQKRYDLDRNGRLDPSEVHQLRRAQAAVEPRTLGSNGLNPIGVKHDGRLDRAARRKTLRSRREAILEQFDANNNGRLDPAERIMLRQGRMKRGSRFPREPGAS